MREHGLSYIGSEYHLRLGVFLSNQRFVRSFNSAGHSFTLSLNHLSCLTPSEYQSLLHPFSYSNVPSRSVFQADPPDSWDWRTQNVVIPPEDQGQCGSGWAICPAHAQASQWAIIGNDLIWISYQELVDCVTTSSGCNGGTPLLAYDYVIAHQNGHFMSHDDYPNIYGDCKWDPSKGVTTILSYFSGEKGDENALLSAVYNCGVPMAAIDASQVSFQLYTNGIYSDPSCSSTNLDHLIVLVGYGADGDGTPFWILQNSWGTAWGEKGYMRLLRNAGNMCGIATASIFPVDQ
jgi:cathepsin L